MRWSLAWHPLFGGLLTGAVILRWYQSRERSSRCLVVTCELV